MFAGKIAEKERCQESSSCYGALGDEKGTGYESRPAFVRRKYRK